MIVYLKCFPKKKKNDIKPFVMGIQSDESMKKPENRGGKK